jgi:hypothetical protein|tara:strand:- start:342 stop:458 length:117 start_codon:yes stop_codon:yes gene_type:complete
MDYKKLKKISGELKKASRMHKAQSERIEKIIKLSKKKR